MVERIITLTCRDCSHEREFRQSDFLAIEAKLRKRADRRINLAKITNKSLKVQWLNFFYCGACKSRNVSSTITERQGRFTEIELRMRAALEKQGLQFEEQGSVKTHGQLISKYVLDFVVFSAAGKIALECDGKNFHSRPEDRAHDAVRDLWLLQHGFITIFRFTGRQIMKNAVRCASQIKRAVDKLDAQQRAASLEA